MVRQPPAPDEGAVRAGGGWRRSHEGGVLWVFLEANEAEVLWTMGWESTSLYDMLASSMAAARQGLDPLTAFTEKLQGLVASLPAPLDSGSMPE